MARWRDWDDWQHFAPSKPLEARGGIRAHNRRGRFGESWWAQRWIAVLESFQIGARLGRGRSYARQGQVLNIEIGKGMVSADVQGSRPKPYHVSIQVKQLTAAEWAGVKDALGSQAIFAAKLLSGEMPQDIEKLFASAGVSLFPGRLRDLTTNCSCPDSANPCKHIAAVYYLLGEEFDRDPFLLFKLRGRLREDLVQGVAAPVEPWKPPEAPEPLPLDAAAFWNGAGLPEDAFGAVAIPQLHAAMPKRLGAFPFWRGSVPLRDAFEPIYARASAAAMDVFISRTV